MSQNIGLNPSPAEATPAEILKHREVLRTAIIGLEDALALPSFGRRREWSETVGVAARALEAAFADHLHLTEQPDGLYHDLLRLSPRLASRVSRLQTDHVEIMSGLSAFLNGLDASSESFWSVDDACIETRRVEGTRLLGLLVRHRQRGIDLTYEVYSVDLGGE